MSIVALLEPGLLDPQVELARLTQAARGDGAIVSFVGLARPESKSGAVVDAVVLDHHPVLSRQSLEDIGRECTQQFAVGHVRIVHRCGTVPAGDPIVFAGATSLHRRAAFEAADYLMDRLKTEALLWKREIGESESVWIEPTEADFADRGRWR